MTLVVYLVRTVSSA